MGKIMINYQSEEFDAYFGREEIFIMIHYADQINKELAKNLFLATFDFNKNDKSNLNTAALLELVNFIDNTLIPSLKVEKTDDIISVLGGWGNLKLSIDQGSDYKKKFGLVSSEDKIFTEIYNYIFFLQSLRDVINNALVLEKSYSVNQSDE